jgi:hypothetical protein
MATETTLDTDSTKLLNALANSVKEGVRDALFERDTRSAMNEQQDRVQNQNKPDPMTTTMAAVNQTLESIRENNENIKTLFSDATRMLAPMSLSKDENKEATPSVTQKMFAMAADDMSLSSGGSPLPGGILNNLKNFFTTSAPSTQMTPDMAGQVNQQVGTDLPKNDAASDRKALLEEEDRAYKAAVRPVMPKLSQALDKILDGSLGVGNGANGNGSGDSGFSLTKLLAALAAGAGGFVLGYIGKWGETIKDVGQGIAKGWNTVKNFVKESSVFKSISGAFESLKAGAIGKINAIKGAFTGFIDSGMAKVETFKNTFTTAIDGWKTKLGLGEKPPTPPKPPKAPPKAPAPKTSGGLLSSLKNLGTKISSHVANLPGVQSAMKWGRIGMKLGEKFPLIQAAGSIVDTGVNVYKGMQKGMSMGEMTDMIMGGTLNAATDLFMVPELMNAAEGMIDSHYKGGSFWDTLKAGGKGFLKMRDKNEIGHGDAMWAQWKEWSKDTPLETVAGALGLEDMVGKKDGDDRYARLLKSYQNGTGWKEAGYEVTSGAAAGFGHSAGVYRPKAAGSLENNRTPNATVTDKMPDVSNMSEADKMNALADKLADGVKNAWLSPEVQEANARNAQATGTAINGSLFGG